MAKSNIPESLLEMHYFRTLVRHYRQALGTRRLQIFKPATTAEHWFGFDQAMFISNNPRRDVIQDLRAYIQSQTAPRFTSFRAFLLQFKVVEVMKSKSLYTPAGWTAPYYRSKLYLEPNANTGISQHETLRRLSGLAGAAVSYVCPMIFNENDVVYRPKFSDLQFVDVSTAPNGWLPTEKHFLAFQQPTSPPTWCSNPVLGKTLKFEQIVERAKPLSADGLFDLLNSFHRVITADSRSSDFVFYLGGVEPNILPRCLSIVAEVG